MMILSFVGAGAFGTVFLGMLKENPHLDDRGIEIYKKMKLSPQHKVAVKRLHNQKAYSLLKCNKNA